MHSNITFFIFSAVFLLFFLVRLPTGLTADVWFFAVACLFFLLWGIAVTIKKRRQ